MDTDWQSWDLRPLLTEARRYRGTCMFCGKRVRPTTDPPTLNVRPKDHYGLLVVTCRCPKCSRTQNHTIAV